MVTKVFKQIVMVHETVFICVKLIFTFCIRLLYVFITTIGDTKLEANVFKTNIK